jgi:hypothetical protein
VERLLGYDGPQSLAGRGSYLKAAQRSLLSEPTCREVDASECRNLHPLHQSLTAPLFTFGPLVPAALAGGSPSNTLLSRYVHQMLGISFVWQHSSCTEPTAVAVYAPLLSSGKWFSVAADAVQVAGGSFDQDSRP